jgi:thiosulfate dehydrogenase (quinone) large subunit
MEVPVIPGSHPPQERAMSNHTITPTASDQRAVDRSPVVSRAGGAAIAALRISLGLVFLWAFLDKTFGLGYATPAARSWVSGGSPTNGFLSHVEVGPFQSIFNSIAGTWWADFCSCSAYWR